MLPILLYSARVFLYPLVLLKHLKVSKQQHPLFELKLPLRLLSKQPLFLTLLSDVHGSRFATIFDVRFDPLGLFFPLFIHLSSSLFEVLLVLFHLLFGQFQLFVQILLSSVGHTSKVFSCLFEPIGNIFQKLAIVFEVLFLLRISVIIHSAETMAVSSLKLQACLLLVVERPG